MNYFLELHQKRFQETIRRVPNGEYSHALDVGSHGGDFARLLLRKFPGIRLARLKATQHNKNPIHNLLSTTLPDTQQGIALNCL